jgi:hypothetical protein
MIQPNPEAMDRLDRIMAEINRLSPEDAHWLMCWLAGAEPAVLERAMQVRAALIASQGPGKGAS